jgi:hypothetical protein
MTDGTPARSTPLVRQKLAPLVSDAFSSVVRPVMSAAGPCVIVSVMCFLPCGTVR